MPYPYDIPRTPCATRPGIGVVAFRDAMLPFLSPGYDLGILNCRPVAGSNQLSEHGKGWAWDVGFRPFCHPRGWWFFNFAVKYRNELGMQYIAWCGQSCRGPNQKDFVHPYGGSSGDHADHVHIAFNAAAAANPNLGRIALALLEQEEDDVTPEEHALLVDAAGQAGFIRNTQIPNIDAELAAIKQKVNSLSSGGGQVDLDALANKVADKLAERLKS